MNMARMRWRERVMLIFIDSRYTARRCRRAARAGLLTINN